MSKERKQMIALSVLLAGIVGVLVYFNIDRLKPRPSGGDTLIRPQVAKLQPMTAEVKEFIGRRDYLELKEFGAVPVRVMGLGSEKPFRLMEKDTEQR